MAQGNQNMRSFYHARINCAYAAREYRQKPVPFFNSKHWHMMKKRERMTLLAQSTQQGFRII